MASNRLMPPERVGAVPWEWFNSEVWRLYTFKKYPQTSKKSPILLAQNGFVYIGSDKDSADKVMCRFCKVCYTGLEQRDDVNAVHNSNCPMTTGSECDNEPWPHQPNNRGLFAPLNEEVHLEYEELSSVNTVPTNDTLSCPSDQAIIHHIGNDEEGPYLEIGLCGAVGQSRRVSGPFSNAEDNMATSRCSATNNAVVTVVRTAVKLERKVNPAPTCRDLAIINTNHALDITNFSLDELSVVTSEPKNMAYTGCHARLASFDQMPDDSVVKTQKENFAKAGFFFTGNPDSTECYYCGLILSNWNQNDNPFIEHAKYSPKCCHLLQMKRVGNVDLEQRCLTETQRVACQEANTVGELVQAGARFGNSDDEIRRDPAVCALIILGFSEGQVVEEAKKMKEEGFEMNGSMLYERLHGKQPRTAAGDEEEENLENINKELRKQFQCKMCQKEKVKMLLLPCRHLVVCIECGNSCKNCPKCNEIVKGTTIADLQTFPILSGIS